MLALVLATLLLVISFWLKSRQRFKKFPPGPTALPLVGHLPFLGKEVHKTLTKWSKIYGPVIGISLGRYKAVVIHDTKLIREAMNLNELTARPDMLKYIARGISHAHGKEYMEARNFLMKNLREFGVGKKSMETKIMEEVEVLLKELRVAVGQPRDLKFAFNVAAINCLSSILFSETFDTSDPKINDIIQRNILVLDEMNWITGLSVCLPWLKYVIPEKLTFEYMVTRLRHNLEEFVQNMLEKHSVNYVPDQPRDIADVFADKVRNTRDDVTTSFFHKPNIILYTLSEVFLAGLDSVSKTLQWMYLYLINYPEVQKKLQDEIDKVIGPDRSPCLADRPLMNYTEAVILEILRHSSTIFLSLPRRSLTDVEFHGYVIPKDTIILGNFFSFHVDKEIWGDPENFRPERFLDNEGNVFGKHTVSVFGMGKRSCPGEGLARDELFLFLVNLFQHFTFQPTGDRPPTIQPQMTGIANLPKHFEVILQERNSGNSS